MYRFLYKFLLSGPTPDVLHKSYFSDLRPPVYLRRRLSVFTLSEDLRREYVCGGGWGWVSYRLNATSIKDLKITNIYQRISRVGKYSKETKCK